MLRLPCLSPCLSPRHLHPPIPCSPGLFSPTNINSIEYDDSRRGSHRYLWRIYRSISYRKDEDESSDKTSVSDPSLTFEEAVKLFNQRSYYACHDLLESLWYDSNDSLRTLLHALLQCAVAFHHLFNQNHKGAMMEMGEGVCKLRKLNLDGGPFYQFEQEISDVLNFIYQTQLELAACNEDFCVAMEQNERSYQLLEGFGAGQRVYFIDQGSNEDTKHITHIVFDPQISYGGIGVPSRRVKLPTLQATASHFIACENY